MSEETKTYRLRLSDFERNFLVSVLKNVETKSSEEERTAAAILSQLPKGGQGLEKLVSLRLDTDKFNTLQEIAYQRRITVSDLLREAVNLLLEREKENNSE